MAESLHPGERVETLGGVLSCVISPDHGFGTDAMLLADFAAPKQDDLCMDLGTGCGIIPLLWKRDGAAGELYGLDIQEGAIDQFRRGIRLSEADGADMANLHPVLGDLRDLDAAGLPLGQFRTVTMNPPYKPVGTGILSGSEAEQIARHETLCTVEDAAKAASRLLNHGGRFCICHRPERLADVLEAFRANGIEPKRLRFVQKCADTSPWLFLLEGRKGGKPYLSVLPPLLIRNEDGTDSEELLHITGDYRND